MVSEQQEHPEGAVVAQERNQPAGEPEAPVAPSAPEQAAAEQAPAPEQPGAAEQAPAVDPPPAAEAPAAPSGEEPPAPDPAPVPGPDPAPAPDPAPLPDPVPGADAPAAAEAPAAGAPPSTDEPVGPKILGVAEERRLPVVKKRLQEKPKREPLPWPELRAAVAATREDLDIAQLKELFRTFPEKLREEVTENVRGFKKGARRPVSQHAAKQLARAAHTARRMKRNSHPSGEVAEALGQAMAAELIASLEPEKAAQVILPKRDLLEREARQAQRRARDEEDKRRDEQRRKRRDDARSSRQQTSFGEFSGAKIKGLDELAALFADNSPAADEPEAQAPATPAAEPETPAAEPEAPVTPATTAADPDAQVEGEVAPETPADESLPTGSAPQPDTDDAA
jgi:hypothetical protein